METAELRRRFLDYFTARDHVRLPSGSLVPPAWDTSTLFTIAGMQPLRRYFVGLDAPPAPRTTSAQRVFRTPDIDEVGLTARHLTFFEMLGNFSFGDYFKEGATAYAWELSTSPAGLGLDPDQIWVTVFRGDEGVP